MKTRLVVMGIALSALSWNGVQAQSIGSITDPRDGQTYKTASYEDPLLGEIVIMAENLNYEMEGTQAYNNNEKSRAKLGLLYTWTAALKACPPGWHLPSDSEWDRIITILGGDERRAANSMKSTFGWSKNKNGTNQSGFNALPAGWYYSYSGVFRGVGDNGIWWSSTENNSTAANRRSIVESFDEVYSYDSLKGDGHSCRCFKD